MKSKNHEVPAQLSGLSDGDPYQTLFTHVVETLPDSLGQRKKILENLGYVMAGQHPARPQVEAQLAAIAAVENMTAELQRIFRVLT